MRTWILQRWQVYARITVMIGLFVSPVIFNRGTQDVFNLVKFAVLWVTGIAAAALYIAWAAERGVWFPRFGLGWAALAFLGVGLIVTIASDNKVLSLIGLYHRYGGLIPFALYVGIMFTIVGLYWEKPLDLRDLAIASSGASVLLLTYVLVQAAGQDWIAWKDSSGGPPPYPVGTMGNSNFAGGYLGIAIPFLVYVAASAKTDWVKLLGYITSGLSLVALWFTQTRGGMIAGAAGLLTMAFMYRDRLPKWVSWAAMAMVAGLAAIAFAVLWHPGSQTPYGPLERVDAFRTGTFDVRTYYWGTAVRIFKENPVAGVGLDLYYANYPKHRLPRDGAQLGLTITDKPHNIFLEYLANGGILLFAAYMSLVGLALFRALRANRKLPDRTRFVLVAFTSVLAGYLAQGIFSIDVPPLAVMGWVGIAGIAVVTEPRLIAAREARAPEGGRKKAKRAATGPAVKRHGPTLWPVHATLTVVAIGLMFIGFQPVRADASIKSATEKQAAGIAQGVDEGYERAIELNPFEASYRSQAGLWYETRAQNVQDPPSKIQLFKKAEAHYLEAHSMQRGNVFYMMNLGRLYTLWGPLDTKMYEKAESWWSRAVEHDPTDWDIRNRYALFLNTYANAKFGDETLRKRTAAQLEKVVQIKPDQVDAWINLGKVYSALQDQEKALAAFKRAKQIDPANEEVNKILQNLGQTETSTG